MLLCFEMELFEMELFERGGKMRMTKLEINEKYYTDGVGGGVINAEGRRIMDFSCEDIRAIGGCPYFCSQYKECKDAEVPSDWDVLAEEYDDYDEY